MRMFVALTNDTSFALYDSEFSIFLLYRAINRVLSGGNINYHGSLCEQA